MSKALVTGAAGFIGSHLSERLLSLGYDVVGVDAVLANDQAIRKRENLSHALANKSFRFIEGDLATTDLAPLLDGVEAVFHLAGQPGVRKSWGTAFSQYSRNNIDATQRLLESCTTLDSLQRFVFASTSSVYGDAEVPMLEESPTRPVSPYGVTKRAAEHLCHIYFSQFGVPAVTLRYFSVYGPRQRPDMAFDRFIRQALRGETITLYGGGAIKRDFTYVDDVVDATLRAAHRSAPGEMYNVGSGTQVTLREVIDTLEHAVNRSIDVRLDAHKPAGDMGETRADISKARLHLGYAPQIDLKTGLKHQVDWIRRRNSTKML